MAEAQTPSWLRWPPNCCETCTGPWIKKDEWTGVCAKVEALEYGAVTDARFRCPSFVRKTDAASQITAGS